MNDWLEAASSGWTPNLGQVATSDGQVARDVLYTTATPGGRVYVTRTGLTHLFVVGSEDYAAREESDHDENENRVAEPGQLPEASSYEWARVDVSLVGAAIRPELADARGRIDAEGTQNFYLAHCPDGVLDVPAYSEVSFPGVYPGVDWLVRNAPGDGVHHDFVVAPGADPGAIRLRYEGATALRVSDDGQSLIIRTALGDVREGSLFCHQGNLSEPVSARFELAGNEVSVRVGNYDRSKPLVIDPPLVWSTYYGGTLYDGPRSIWCDNANAVIYVVGYTGSFDLPAFNPGGGTYYQGTSGGARDAFLWKFSQSGQRLWATYYGGSADEGFSDCALDAAGNLYVGGTTTSTNLPVQVLGGAFNDGSLGGIIDGYFVKFNPSGVRLWASYIGGSDNESLEGVAVDAGGQLQVCGFTMSTNYPLTNPGGGAYFQPSPASTTDAFLSRFSATGMMNWSTYLGGNDDDYAHGIITSPSGNIFVTGMTVSTTFPVLTLGGAYNQGANGGGQDGFIARFSSGGVQQWTTYYGGSGNDIGDEPALDASGNLYFYGMTSSTDFPTLNSGGAYYQGTYGGGGFDLFLIRFNGAATRTWGTYIGGNGIEFLNGPGGKPITVDNLGRVIITGLTDSSNYPLQNLGGSYFLGSCQGQQDAIITRFNTNMSMNWSTYWGTTSFDFGTSVATNDDACIFATGESVELGSLVNVTPGFWAWNQPANAGSDDGYIAKFCSASSACCIDFTCVPVSSAAECNSLGGTVFHSGQPCSTVVCTVNCTICGTKFNDLNRDGVKQGNEPGLPGWTIQLNYPGGAPYATTTTDGMGNYCFVGVPCGPWEVAEVHQPGWVQIYPGGPGHTLNTTTGTTTSGVNFGNYECLTPPPCATPPTGLAARWVFGDDPVTGVALDVAHTEPVRNAATLTTGGSVPDLLCLSTPADRA
ncbi:MAG TPA: SBBP repeat-containing protein, partial [Candidatus Eisenbacteria bacterium]